MKISILIGILFCSTIFACGKENDDRFIFFLHNRFLEEHKLSELHPEFGRTEYEEIITEFEKSGLKVISEKRNRTEKNNCCWNFKRRIYCTICFHFGK